MTQAARASRLILSSFLTGAIVALALLSPLAFAKSEIFRLLDQHGKSHSSCRFSKFQRVRFVYVRRTCLENVSESHFKEKVGEPSINSLTADAPITVWLTDDPHTERGFYKRFSGPVLFDDLDFLVNLLKLRTTGDTVEVVNGDFSNPSAKTSDQYFLQVEGCRKPVSHSAVGLDVGASIFQEACMKCHMQIEKVDYFRNAAAIVKWKSMMLKTMETFRMPPGGVDSELLFKIKGLVKREDLKKLYKWLSQIETVDSSLEKKVVSMRNQVQSELDVDKRRRKNPLLKIKMSSPDRVAGTSQDQLIYSLAKGPLADDYFVHSARFSNSADFVHHNVLLTTSFKPDDLRLDRNSKYLDDLKKNGQLVAATVDGKPTRAFDYETNILFSFNSGNSTQLSDYSDNFRARIPNGSYLIFNNHYSPISREATNRTSVEIFGEKGSTSKTIVRRRSVQLTNISIPKGRSDYTATVTVPIKKDILLHAFQAHMHYRGAEVFVKRSTGCKELETIAAIPFFLYKHNSMVYLEEPLRLEQGSNLIFEAKFDNSSTNISNPNPDLEVPYGLSVYDNEMLIMFYVFTDYNPKPNAETTPVK